VRLRTRLDLEYSVDQSCRLELLHRSWDTRREQRVLNFTQSLGTRCAWRGGAARPWPKVSAAVSGADEVRANGFRTRLDAIHAAIRQLQQSAVSLEPSVMASSLAQLEALIVQTIAHFDELTAPDGSMHTVADSPHDAAPPSPTIRRTVRTRRTQRARVPNGQEAPLTEREREVVMLIGRGYTNEQIAAELHVVKGTVATHVQHLLTKLNCTSRVQVATWAAARGLLDGITLQHEPGSAKSTHM
jgi:DNA-binding NarL/FixJ family response regulator